MRRGSSSASRSSSSGSGGNSSRSRSKLNAFRRRLLERANIPIPQTGLSDERISKLWQDTLKMRALMKKRKEQGVSDLEAGVSQSWKNARHAETGRSTSVQRRMEQIPQCRLETVDPDFSCPHRYWKGGGSCVTCSSVPVVRCVMWPVVSAALFLAAARVPPAPDFPMEVIVMRPRYVQGEFDFSRAAGSARASRSSGS